MFCDIKKTQERLQNSSLWWIDHLMDENAKHWKSFESSNLWKQYAVKITTWIYSSKSWDEYNF